MEGSSVLRLAVRGVPAGAMAGLLVGGIEALPLALGVKIELSLVQLATLVGISGVLYAAIGAVVSLCVGLPLHGAMRRIVVARGLAAQLALTTGLLLLLLFSGFAVQAFGDGRYLAALMLLFMPLLLTFTTFLLASRLYRDADRSRSPFGTVAAVGGGGYALLLIAGLVLRGSTAAGGLALPTDPRFVVVVVDALRADLHDLPAPNLQALAAEGVHFTSAITPQPDTAPAVASLLTGLAPLRHEVLGAGDRLRRVEALLPATFRSEGYATGGFVSTPDLRHELGFGYGFQVYDDELVVGMHALWRLRPLALVQALIGAPSARPDDATVDRFLAWLDGVTERPFFAMVHLHGPRAPFRPHGLPGFEANGTLQNPVIDHAAILDKPVDGATDLRLLRRLYREEVAAVDAQIGRIMQAIGDRQIDDRVVLVVVGTGGQLLGEHGGVISHRGLYDPTVRVPLIVRVPGGASGAVVDADVRMFDLYATLLEHAELRSRHESDAIPLGRYLRGERSQDLSSTLIGRDLDGGWSIGVRNNGVKYIQRLDDDGELLFDLDEDPEELDDVMERMPQTADQARGMLSPHVSRLRALLRRRSTRE